MITIADITEIGVFLKPHGIKGEIAAELDIEADEISSLSCIICNMDGIFVPFFIDAVRAKGKDTVLLTIEGITDEKIAGAFIGKNIYAKADEVSLSDENDGLYVTDMNGYSIFSPDGSEIGLIERVDSSTANILFIVNSTDGETIYIPAAEEFIQSLDIENKAIVMDLPDGLI